MATGCEGLLDDILLNCNKPISAGVKDDFLYLINYDDIESTTVDPNNANLITGIILVSGARAFKFQGKNSSIEPRTALVRQRYSEVYDHEVTFKVFDNGADVKQNIQGCVTRKVVAIVENRFRGSDDDAAFEIYGISAGLQANTLERITADTDTQGAYNVVLGSSEQEKEPNLPATFFDVDYATTKAAVEALAS
jgi:hypothetical protein